MLGHIFGSRKGAVTPSPSTILDSTTEECHTRHLLYPDVNTLYHPEGQPYPLHGAQLTPGSAHDGPLPEIDLEFPRDCRIIIAQDESMGQPKAILFDSKPGPPRADSPTHNAISRPRIFSGSGSTTSAGPTFGGMHARRSSLVTEPTPRSPTVGGFSRIRQRGTSISSMPHIDEHAQAQAQAQAQAKTTESIDVVKMCLDCMFGSTTMSYRGNTNKLHIVPLEPRASENVPNLQDTPGSLGRGDGFRRRSNLATSYTPADPPADLARDTTNEPASKEPRRRTIFITRLFSVNLPDDEQQDTSNVATPTPGSSLGKGNGFPFPPTGGKQPRAGKLPSQTRKTPMYAITIILQLPIAAPPMIARPPSRTGHRGRASASQPSTSAPGHDSLGSSLDSDRRAGWAHIDPNFSVESVLSASLNSDVDDRVDVIGQHWDVITRTLTSLQQVVQGRILAHLKMEDANYPPVVQLPRNQPTRYANRELPVTPARRGLKLQPNALAADPVVKEAVELSGCRVVSGMRIPRVITGQGKWGVWREEARWLGRWAGRREENFFFYNLLTAFLGNHTEWLNSLGPTRYRKRHREQQRSSTGENLTISNRTVIVSPDKMAARRLIFLLAAFLPPNSTAIYDGASPMRPSTSASLRGYSQSPPVNTAPSRKQSLRRQINRRGKQSLSSTKAPPGLNPTSSAPEIALPLDDGQPVEPGRSRQARRSSSHSVHPSLMPPAMSDSVATKSSTASLTTVTPENSVPVAHFTLPRTKSYGPSPDNRPESSESLASANLMNTLRRTSVSHQRQDSTDSQNSSRWSNVFTNLWPGGRRQSISRDILQTTDDGVGTTSSAGSRNSGRPLSQLELMVQELSMDRDLFDDTDVFDPSAPDITTPAAESSPDTYPLGGSSGVPPSKAQPIPRRHSRFDSGFKLSVNAKDGVVDVDIPLPDFGSPLQSPLLGPYGSASSQQGSSYGETSVFSVPPYEPDQPVNAAGWLKQFHPDFAVQAIKPYEDIDRDIRRAMSAEPTPITPAVTPSVESGPLERWIDVCSALVADTRTFSVKRIRLRRLVKLIPTPTTVPPALTPSGNSTPGRSQYGNPYAFGNGPLMTEIYLEEKFSEETIMDFDGTLIDAVDRVLAQSGQSSRVQSATSSRSSSRRGRRDTRSGTELSGQQQQAEIPHTDCKGIIFEALESVVKNVTAERSGKDGSKEDASNGAKTKTDVTAKPATDSSLREGIRRWLTEVE